MINKKYSGEDFTGKTFRDVDPSEFSNSTIRGSCFAQEVSYDVTHTMVKVFPDGVENLTIEKCNMDNVEPVWSSIDVEPGPMIDGSYNRKIQIQNDLDDWVLDKTSRKPTEPMSKKLYLKMGLSINPKDIPRNKMDITLFREVEQQLRIINGTS